MTDLGSSWKQMFWQLQFNSSVSIQEFFGRNKDFFFFNYYVDS